jgi:hypothetical protein
LSEEDRPTWLLKKVASAAHLENESLLGAKTTESPLAASQRAEF